MFSSVIPMHWRWPGVANLEPLKPACALNGNHSGFSSNLKKWFNMVVEMSGHERKHSSLVIYWVFRTTDNPRIGSVREPWAQEDISCLVCVAAVQQLAPLTQSLFGINICRPDSLLLLDGLLCGDLNSFILVHSRIIRSPFKTWITLKVNESPHSIRGKESNSWKLDHGGCSGAFYDLLRSTASYFPSLIPLCSSFCMMSVIVCPLSLG